MTRTTRLANGSVNHSAPSAPAAISTGGLRTLGAESSVTVPDVVMRPILTPTCSVNHRAPSGPFTIHRGPLWGAGSGNSVIVGPVAARAWMPGASAASSARHDVAVPRRRMRISRQAHTTGCAASSTGPRAGAYARRVPGWDADADPEPWGEDAKLDALLGAQGAAGFRAMFDGFPEAVGVLWALRERGGRIVDFAFGYANPSMMRGFRLSAAMRDRYTLLEALPRMRGSRAFDAYVRACDQGEPWVREVTYDNPFADGYMRGTFVHRAAKLGDGLVVFLTDVTEQRRMEAELRSFADVVAHDLREPVTGIGHLVTLLERRASEPPQPDVLRLLRASAVRASELIDGVLAYARAGELRRERVALDRLMGEVAEDLRPGLEAAGASLEVGELPEVDGDARQLRRVLQNLVGNAVKFRGEAPLRVELSAEDAGGEWLVTVRDNGAGVDPDHASRIFGMFSRVRTDADGTGIGLAVCRRVVEAHGGRIWVEAAEGGGSAFRFTLPYEMVDRPPV